MTHRTRRYLLFRMAVPAALIIQLEVAVIILQAAVSRLNDAFSRLSEAPAMDANYRGLWLRRQILTAKQSRRLSGGARRLPIGGCR